jgi:hypothetical protein
MYWFKVHTKGEKGMRLYSATAPATVIEDKSLYNHSNMGLEKMRKIHKSGDLPKFAY